MCNLYRIRTNQEAIREAARAMHDRLGNLPPTLDVYPDYPAPIVRAGADGEREMVMARWGMPTPPIYVKGDHDTGVTNIRNVSSPHWRRWLGVEHRCVVPATSFSEYGPRPAGGGRRPLVWFAVDEDEPLFFMAGLSARWHGKRKAKEDAVDHELFAFLTCDPNSIVAPIHPKAMPVILTEPNEVETWLTAPWEAARELQRPLDDDRLIVLGGK